jgi:UMF1 family MFS transporter
MRKSQKRPLTEAQSRRRKAWFGWCLYDWANSAFATVILAAVLPVYFASLVPEEGATISVLGWSHVMPVTALWGYAVSASMLLVALLAPYLGAWADSRRARKRFLILSCLFGSTATALLALAGPGDYLLAALLFIAANIGFATGNIFYNSFLPALAEKSELDKLSARGFALGYIGGGLALLVTFIIIQQYHWFGLPDKAVATRVGFALTGLWWLGFALPAFRHIREDVFVHDPEPLQHGLGSYFRTFSRIRHYPELLRFLIAFLFYNDGIQTVIAVSAIFASAEIGLSQGSVLGCFLMIQFVAMPGALLFSRISASFGAKKAIMLSLLLFIAVTIYAFRMDSALEFWLLGFVVALILGGSQAISRSLFATMVPADRSAEFFGFYAVSGKFASILGPLVFAVISDITGSARLSILALSGFFIVGLLLLGSIDIKKGQTQADATLEVGLN